MSQFNLPPQGFPPPPMASQPQPAGYQPPAAGVWPPQPQPPYAGFGGDRPRSGTPWLLVVIFALLGLVVGFAGGARLGYVVGTGGPAAARAALGTGGIDNRADGNGGGNGDSARASATASSVYTLRSQLALYRLQHNDNYPTLEQLEDNWRVIVGRTDLQGRPAGDRQAGMVFGPYMQSLPVNPLNGKTGVCPMSAAHAEAGWAYDAESGQIKAISPYGSAGNTMSSDLVVHVPR